MPISIGLKMRIPNVGVQVSSFQDKSHTEHPGSHSSGPHIAGAALIDKPVTSHQLKSLCKSTNRFNQLSGKLLLQLCVGVGSALSKQFLHQKQVLRKKCLKLSKHFFLANVQAMENTTVTFHLHLVLGPQNALWAINGAGWFWYGSKLWGFAKRGVVPRRMGLLLLLPADKADHQFCDKSDLHIGLGFKVGHDIAPPGQSKIQRKHQGCGQTATNALPRRQQFDESSFCRVRIQFPFGDLGKTVVSSNSTFLCMINL